MISKFIAIILLLQTTLLITEAEESLAAHSFITLDGTTHSFSTPDKSPTLLIIVSQQEDLKEAFRIATIFPSSSSSSSTPPHYFIAIDLSPHNFLKARSLKTAANKFLKSDASRQTITILENDSLQKSLDAHNQGPTKSALIDAQGTISWTSSEFPSDTILAELTSEQSDK